MHCQFAFDKPPAVLRHHLNLGRYNRDTDPVDLTSQYLTKGGKPWLPVMGEFHFSRCPREDWAKELAKMKAGGIRLVSTYLFWICHEEEEGVLDFAGENDVRAFVELCGQQGLFVVLRIGPWAHGEARNGGFPDWLVAKGLPLRTDDPTYLFLVRKWFSAIFQQVQGLFYEDGGPVIAVQIENELTNGAQHLLTLKKMAEEIGFRVPLYTVTGWNAASGARIPVDEVLPVFSAYPDAPWSEGTDPLPLSPHYVFNPERNDAAVGADLIQKTAPDGWHLPYERYPFATCELGPGQQSTYHRRVRISPMDAYALSLVKLGSGNNLIGYYMYHGGTNQIGKHSTFQESRATGYPNDYPIRNYDFDTALSEYGEARPQYGMLNLLHLFAEDFGEALAPMHYVPSLETPVPEDETTPRTALRTDGRSGFVFVCHHQRHKKLAPWKDLVLSALGVTFPAIDVTEDTAFFFPVRMQLGERELAFATAQPICRQGEDWYFARIPGIPAVYHFADGQEYSGEGDGELDLGAIRIHTLPFAEAVYLRRLDGQMILGERSDWYLLNGNLAAIEGGTQRYWTWEGTRRVSHEVLDPAWQQAKLLAEPCAAPFAPPYEEELRLGGDRPISWQKLSVTSPCGFVEIRTPFDIAELFVDGKFAADSFGIGRPWRLPASLLYQKSCYLITTPENPAVYHEPAEK